MTEEKTLEELFGENYVIRTASEYQKEKEELLAVQNELKAIKERAKMIKNEVLENCKDKGWFSDGMISLDFGNIISLIVGDNQ